MTGKSRDGANLCLTWKPLILGVLGVELVTFVSWKFKMAYTKVAKA